MNHLEQQKPKLKNGDLDYLLRTTKSFMEFRNGSIASY